MGFSEKSSSVDVTQFDPDLLPEVENPERKGGRILSLRLNDEEAKELEHLKDLLDTQNDGRVIKLVMRLGYSRLHEVLSDEDLKWLSRRDRARTFGVKGTK